MKKNNISTERKEYKTDLYFAHVIGIIYFACVILICFKGFIISDLNTKELSFKTVLFVFAYFVITCINFSTIIWSIYDKKTIAHLKNMNYNNNNRRDAIELSETLLNYIQPNEPKYLNVIVCSFGILTTIIFVIVHCTIGAALAYMIFDVAIGIETGLGLCLSYISYHNSFIIKKWYKK